MKTRRFVVTLAFGVALILLHPSDAGSQIVPDILHKASLSLSATIGFDEPTRYLLEHMPANIREQMLGLLKDALPIIGQSIQTYLDQVNSIVEKQIDHATCSMVGLLAGLADVPKEMIGKNPKPMHD